MGKRKSARKPMKRTKQTLDQKFACLYCSHEDTVTVKLDQANKIGNLACRACGVSYQSKIHALAEPVDVYSQWIDSAEDAQKVEDERRASTASARRNDSPGAGGDEDGVGEDDVDEFGREDDDEEERAPPRANRDDFVVDDEDDDEDDAPRQTKKSSRSRYDDEDEDEEDEDLDVPPARSIHPQASRKPADDLFGDESENDEEDEDI